ncbi:MAG: hypothetical protein ACLQED_08220 [Desulfobaccales bacterium]
MHNALFVARVSGVLPEKWHNFLTTAKAESGTFPGVSRLAENVWIVDFQENPAPLSYLVSAADAHGVHYGILPFEHELQWLPVGFDPKTILGRSADS